MARDLHVNATQRTVASYDTYAEAQHAVDHLSDRGFPVQHVRIVGEGLRYVEQVTGRRGYGSSAMAGAASGAAIGAFVGFLMGLFSLFDPLVSAVVLALWGLLIGAVVGALLGLIGHAASRGRRDFDSVEGVQATRFDVVVEPEHADDATRMLADLGPRR